ncbi:MAG: thioredoxin domain-containing protein [Desulfobacterales bacterium]|nr:thioredoxin domain-containing protein [Desulfobacterales bacterium]
MKRVTLFFALWIIMFLFSQNMIYATEISMDEKALKEFIIQVIKDNPELIYKTANEYVKQMREKQLIQKIDESFKNRVIDEPRPNNPVKGPANAPITIIEYTDFQCPYCSRGAITMHSVLQKYSDKVKLVFKNLPLSSHQLAMMASQASLAAHKQGKFWEYHDILFQNSTMLKEPMFEEFAKQLGLDLVQFNADRQSEAIQKQIEEEKAQANKLQFTGTPVFIVNGVVVQGAQDLNYFSLIIDRLLSEISSTPPTPTPSSPPSPTPTPIPTKE